MLTTLIRALGYALHTLGGALVVLGAGPMWVGVKLEKWGRGAARKNRQVSQ